MEIENTRDILFLILLKEYCKTNNISNISEILNFLKKNKIILTKEFDTTKFLNNSILLEMKKLINFNTNTELVKKNNKDIIINNFEIKEKLGKGSYGSVYKTRNIIDNSNYALKILKIKQNLIGNIYEEVKYMARLKHKNIIDYNSCWISSINNNVMDKLKLDYKINKLDDSDILSSDVSINSNKEIAIISNENINNYLFIQMELCSSSLSKYIKIRPKIDEKLNKQIFFELLSGVKYLHENGIIHRDLKPSNILLNNKIVKICDFGMSKDINSKIENIEDDYFGTYIYLAPESFNENKYSFKSDIYSLGIIFYELINSFDTQMEKYKNIEKIKQGLIDIPDKIKTKILKNILEKDIEKRWCILELLNYLKSLDNC